MNRPVAVGKSDTTSKVFYFSTVADGEEAIALLETVIPVAVRNELKEYFNGDNPITPKQVENLQQFMDKTHDWVKP